MNSIANRQPNPSPEIEYSEILIPDEGNLGTGSFTTRIKTKTLLAGESVSSLIVLVPHFQLSVNLNPATGKVPILLGRADGTSPLSRKVFLLPQNIDHSTPHDFIVKFQDWNIMSFTMDTDLLEEETNMRKSFFTQLATLLEQIMPNGWFNNPKNKANPAYQRWAFCQKMISQNGSFRLPEQESELPLLGQLLLDGMHLITITEGDLQQLTVGNFDQYIKSVKDKIVNYLTHLTQFDDIMLELSFAAWHLIEKHKTEILEVANYPDIKVDIPGCALPIYAECKNVTTPNENSIKRIITHANEQLKNVSERHYGIVILNIGKLIKMQPVNSDAYPEKVDELIKLVTHSLSGKRHRSVGAAILIWDDYMQLGNPQQEMLIAYRRRFVRIDHTPEEGCIEIPQNAELFEGYTSEFTINFKPRI